MTHAQKVEQWQNIIFILSKAFYGKEFAILDRNRQQNIIKFASIEYQRQKDK